MPFNPLELLALLAVIVLMVLIGIAIYPPSKQRGGRRKDH